MEATKKPTPVAIITKSSMVITSAGVLQTLRFAMNAEPGGFDAD
jgi:hypothetical protein